MREQFTEMLKTAMKAGDKRRVDTLRMIQAKLKDIDIEARGSGKEVKPDDILAMLQKMVKSRQESADIYAKAGRAELAAQENEEIAILNEFLPKQMDEAEMKAAHEGRKGDRKDRHEERRAKIEQRMAEATPEQRAKLEAMRAKHAEMREMRSEMRGERHEKMWAATDADGNGAISLAEMQAHARQRFDKMDANGNGQIDPDERPAKRGHRGSGGKR